MNTQKQILIVEDSHTQARRYSRFFEEQGFDVAVVSSGPQCLRHVNNQSPDAILMDEICPVA